MEAESTSPEQVDNGPNIDESSYISPNVAAALAGEKSEMGKTLLESEERDVPETEEVTDTEE